MTYTYTVSTASKAAGTKANVAFGRAKASILLTLDEGMVDAAVVVYDAAYKAAYAAVKATGHDYAKRYADAVVSYKGDANAPAKTNAVFKNAYGEAVYLSTMRADKIAATAAARAVNKAFIVAAYPMLPGNHAH